MQNTYHWSVIPKTMPTVIKYCSKCNSQSDFENSGNFRVNANQNNIDVWLIYQCNKCNTTWNMEILSRTNSGSIPKEMYDKYLQNDNELAKKYSFDVAAHSRNHSNLNYDNILFEVTGDSLPQPPFSEPCQIELTCEYPLDIRIDKILSIQLGLSRETIKKLNRNGSIIAEGIKDLTKTKLKNKLIITLQNIIY